MRLITASLIGLLIASPLLAQEPVGEPVQDPSQESSPEGAEHVVRQGDTLWDLAGHYFTNPYQWPTIYRANTMVVEDPHWIYPNEVLVIPGIQGDRGTPMAAPVADRASRTLFYREPPARPATGQATVLSEPAGMTYPVKVGEYMAAPYLARPNQLDVRGLYMRTIRDDRELSGPATSSHPQDRSYIAYAGDSRPAVGDRYLLVDADRESEGARGGEHIIQPRGVIRIVQLEGEVMEGRIESQFGPIYPNQVLIPMSMFPDFMAEQAEPVEGGSDLEGRILEFRDDRPIHSRADIAFLDIGARHGVQEGDVFHAYLPTRTSKREIGLFEQRPESLPPEYVAELRVIRITDDYATVRVDDLALAHLEAGLPVQRIRRMP